MRNTEHRYAEILRAIADGKKIVRHGVDLNTSTALELIAANDAEDLAVATDTIKINGVEVPAPYQGEMQNGQRYWVADPTSKDHVSCFTWRNDAWDRSWWARGLIHLDESAAAAHGRAMVAASAEGGAA